MNGLTIYEIEMLKRLRVLAKSDIDAAKAEGIAFAQANKERYNRRMGALRTVKGMFSHRRND